MDITDWRTRIDEVDRRILELLNERARYVLELAPLKRRDAVPVREPKREAEVFANLESLNEGPLTNQAVRGVFERIMEIMRGVQQSADPLNGDATESATKAPAEKSGKGSNLP